MPAEAAPFFAVVGAAPGSGKTSVALDTCALLRSSRPPFRVGGYSLRPVYEATGVATFAKIGYNAHLLSTGVLFPLARLRPQYGSPREAARRAARQGAYAVDVAAYHRVLDQAFADVDDPSVEALILDDVGGLLGRPPRATRDRVVSPDTRRLEALVEATLDRPKPVTLVFLSDTHVSTPQLCKHRIETHPARVLERNPPMTLGPKNLATLPFLLHQGARLARG